MKILGSLMMAAGVFAAGTIAAQTAPSLDVPYVPTPQRVVEAMLDMVDLRDGDVVWDLGCGDGRLVITAAKRNKVKGVGVDLDPQRIKESKENAKKEGVKDRVEFRVADLFKTDFSDATVLTMYLLQSVNLKLRPVILRDLEPGARIVSHSFNMGEWEADQRETVESAIGALSPTIYHWVVPANVTGRWKWTGGEGDHVLEIQQQFQTFTGTLTINGVKQPVKDGRINGREVKFGVQTADGKRTEYEATADGDTLKGKGDAWSASREAGTQEPIDPTAKAAEQLE
jgi:SAM-dependent methyltransferase